nr:MAG TPA: hypothetical protein [Caudoviricetes sp.]
MSNKKAPLTTLLAVIGFPTKGLSLFKVSL